MVKTKKVKTDSGEAAHILRLFNTISSKMEKSFLDDGQRKQVNAFWDFIKDQMDQMEQRDEDFQNLPKNKIESLQKELIKNDKHIQKNIDEHNLMVQVGLQSSKGFPQGAMMYDDLIRDAEYDLKILKKKIDYEYKVLNAEYEYQTDSEWVKLQLENAIQQYKTSTKNLNEIKQNVSEVENDIIAQMERIKNRRIQILEELKVLGIDLTDKKQQKDKSYIG